MSPSPRTQDEALTGLLAAIRSGIPPADALRIYPVKGEPPLEAMLDAAAMAIGTAAIDIRKESPVRWMELFGARAEKQFDDLSGQANVVCDPRILPFLKRLKTWAEKQPASVFDSLLEFLCHEEERR